MKIKGFRLEELLKESDYIAVYRATQVALERHVLLKVIKSRFATDDSIIERLRREAKSLAKLSHPNLIHIYDFVASAEGMYLVMEYFPSDDLSRLLADGFRPELDEAVTIFRQVLQGLAAVHRHGICHRDLKPANILYGVSGVVKITDFGLAHLKGATGITLEGSVVGTPRYLSPEQVSGNPATPESDIFALGVTMYELLTGISPFEADSFSAVFNKIVQHEPAPVDTLRADVPGPLSSLIHKMMLKSSEERFSTCEKILEGLTRLSQRKDQPGPEPTTSALPSESIETRNSSKKWATVLVGLALIFLLVTGGWWLFNLSGTNRAASNSNGVVNPTAPHGDIFPAATDTLGELSISEAANIRNQVGAPVRDTLALKSRIQPGLNRVPDRDSVAVGDNSTVDSAVFTPGSLLVETSPWGYIWINEDSVGISPMHDLHSLAPGKHTVRVNHPDFPPLEHTIMLGSGETDTVRVNFFQSFGYMRVNVFPWAEVYIDGDFIDNTPLNQPVILHPGRHLVQLKNPGFPEWQRYVEVSPGDTVRLQIEL